MATAAWETQKLSIGSVLARGFGAANANPVAFFGVSLLFGNLPQLAIGYLQRQVLFGSGRSGATVFILWGGMLVSVALFMLVQGALVGAALANADGRRATLGACLATGARFAVPLFGLAILTTLGVAAGSLLLIVPGIILAFMWIVAAPAFVAERIGVIESFGRSRFLTAGSRWRIFGLEFLIVVLLMLLLLAQMIIVRAMGLQPVGLRTLSPFAIVVQLVVGTLTTAYWSSLQTALYVELRSLKDHIAPDRLAEVFA